MNEKTGTEVRLDHLETATEKLGRRVDVLERAWTWAIGAVAGIAALAGALVSGIIKRLVS